MKRKLFFRTGKNRKICAVLDSPDRKTSRPLIIMCHGSGGSKDGETGLILSEKLVPEGIAVMRMDFYGHGESDGCFDDLTITEGIEDVRACLSGAWKMGYRKIALMGSSFGGMCTAATARDRDLFALVLKCPLVYLGPDPEQLDPEDPDFLKGIGPYHVKNVAPRIKAPTFIVHGSADSIIPLYEVEQFYKRLKCEKDMLVIKGADHPFLKKEHFDKMIRSITGYILWRAQSG
ncbi:MAG: alpha/beta fold hydrolase [Chloroflexi bacterium]|nr:alpha/beta fold hydrolase [Chloroflexota bacterium]